MPDFSPISALPTVNPNLEYSTSSTSGTDYIAHYQYVNGTWKRQWVYGNVPDATSGPPSVAYTYIEVFLKVTTETYLLEDVEFSGTGPYVTKQNVDYGGDSSSGGFGTSGGFWTATVGNVIIEAPVGTTSSINTSREKTITLKTAIQQGGYDESLDTSGAFAGYFMQDVLAKARNLCDDFRIDIVEL